MKSLTTLLAIFVPCILVAGGAAYYLLAPPGPDHENTGDNSPGTNPPDGAGPQNLGELVNASNRFAFELLDALSNPDDNLFFSPYSIFTALGMTYEGARNRTADEMRSVLHFPADNQTRWSLFKALIEKLNSGDSGCNLSTANALWIQQDFDILAGFVNTVRSNYKATAENVDYVNAAEEARVRINTRVEDQTNGKIKDLIPGGILDGNTRLVLTNAIYFKGSWLREFNQNLTKEMDFHPAGSTTVKVRMMARKDDCSNFSFADTDGIQVLEMPYAGQKLSMLVLLPKSGSIGSLENQLTLAKLEEWRGKLKEQRVDVYFPKFELETKYFLKDNLSSMGMPRAFSGSADLSGIAGEPGDLYIKEVIHQGFVAVDEKGTEAAGATAVVVELRGPAEPAVSVFKADHPFIFLIQDRETGNILFMGKVSDPTK